MRNPPRNTVSLGDTAPRRNTVFAASVGVLFLSLALGSPAFAVDPVNTGRFGNIAIKGYDPVAYFDPSRAVAGEKSITHEWNGATWRFANAQNRDLFAADPEKYAPQYGGYCAFAVSKGSTAGIDPEAWAVHEDKLYLNYSQSIQKKWRADIAGRIAAADKNWPGLLAD